MKPPTLKANVMNALYAEYNRRERVGGDPVQFLYRFSDPADREIVGLVSALLAYGRVAQIHRSVERLLALLDHRPAEFLSVKSPAEITAALRRFRHRVTSGEELARLLVAIQSILRERGSLRLFFERHYAPSDETLASMLSRAVPELIQRAESPLTHLLPDPARGSACKRLWLYLRWMVRTDAIDVGDFSGLPPSKLLMPVDTHIFRWGQSHSLTRRRTVSARVAEEITSALRTLCPKDPVKYDFCLTRAAIQE